MEAEPTLPSYTVYRPADLPKTSGKLPVIAFGNGGCMPIGNMFEVLLKEVASHGYVVVAPGNIQPGFNLAALPVPKVEPNQAAAAPVPPPTAPVPQPSAANGGPSGMPAGMPKFGTGADLIAIIDWAQGASQQPGSKFRGKLDTSKIAVMGQSCGGLMALVAAADPRVKTIVMLNSGLLPGGVPVGMPADAPAAARAIRLPGTTEDLKRLHTPIAYFVGGPSDIAYRNAEDDFSRISGVPLFSANMDAGHNGTWLQPHGGAMARGLIGWLNWQLRNDAAAAKLFVGPDCGLCTDAAWTVKKKNLR